MATQKHDLPEKTCAVCQRPFRWRRKWARDWDAVRYCSKRCRGERGRVRSAENVQAANDA